MTHFKRINSHLDELPGWLIRKISLIVPGHLRADWKREWESEILSRDSLNRKWQRDRVCGRADLIRRSMGAFVDALLLQPRRLEQELVQDIRYGFRGLLRSPGFTAVALCTLILGMGATTAIFSVVNAVVFKPLPYYQPAQLYRITGSYLQKAAGFSGSDLATWREKTQVFSQMATVTNLRMFLSRVAEPAELHGLGVTRDCLPLLGTQPFLGRLFADGDFDASSPRTVIIGYSLWKRACAGDAGILGKVIHLDSTSHVVIGIMPPEFQFTQKNREFWIPLQLQNPSSLEIYARAKSGVTRQSVMTETDHMFHLLMSQSPRLHKPDWKIAVTPIQEAVVAKARPTMLLLLGSAGFVLMIACLNVSNLLLARGAERKKEIAIKAALGASRSRIARQLLTESFLLFGIGGSLAVLFSWWANKALVLGFSQNSTLPRFEQTGMDTRVLGFAFVLIFVVNLIFGFSPARQISDFRLVEGLQNSGRGARKGLRSERFRNILIVAESALSIVLLAGAGVMLRSFYHLITIDPGFKTANILTVNLPLPTGEDHDRSPAYYAELLDTVKALPGVDSAGLTTALPLSAYTAVMYVAGFPNGIETRGISPEYLALMGVPVVSGRNFEPADNEGAASVGIVNETLARTLWPDGKAVGRKINSRLTVVGIAGDVRHRNLSVMPQPELFLPFRQFPSPLTTLVVHTRQNPLSLSTAIRSRIHELRPYQPVEKIRTMKQVVRDSISDPRLYALLWAVFGGLALLLAIIGIYGVMFYSVNRRKHEIGVRLALGARAGDILRQFLIEGGSFVCLGMLLGIGIALFATKLLASLLFDVKPNDPTTLLVISLCVLISAVVAIYMPARTAAKLDPLQSLKNE